MTDIAGIPYVEAQFDKNGNLTNPVSLPSGVTDLLVISHGWNNNADEARGLYRRLFENFKALTKPGELPGKTFAIVGVIWPSKKFDEMVAAAQTGGGASLDSGSVQALLEKLESMKPFFDDPGQQQTLDELKAMVGDLEDKASVRRAFVAKLRTLLDPGAANEEDRSDAFFKDDGNEIFKSLQIDAEDLDEDLTAAEGTASMPVRRAGSPGAAEGAAGLGSFLSGFKASAMNVLNFTTYYEMKARAGTVGKNGVAPLIDRLEGSLSAIHLIGHSFGGRVVSATAAASRTGKIRSLTLLQAAFSHNGFSRNRNGFFRSVVDNGRVKGPILITHTKNDKAVGVAYPLASRLNGDRAAALGDANDEFGGMGRNGAQKMEANETEPGKLLAVGSQYRFAAGKCFNLEASEFISDHGAVTGREVAQMIKTAVSL